MIVVPLGVVISHLTGVADTIEKNPDVVVPLMPIRLTPKTTTGSVGRCSKQLCIGGGL